jgi:hypothetical protein
MKNKLLLVVFGLLMTTQMILAQVPSYVPTNGLVGYWPFNGNANDQSVNGNNGTVNGATLTTDRFGNSNSAYSFEGSSSIQDYIIANNPISNQNSFSISYWVSRADINNPKWHLMINDNNNSTGTYEFFSKMDTIYFRNFGGSGLNFDLKQKVQIPNNSAFNVCVTSDNNSTKLFINGIQYQETSIQKIKPLLGMFYVGKHANFTTQSNSSFNGKLDDIGIWNRALTQQEITAMYNGVNYSDTCNAVSGSLTNGLVAYYPFCGNANDDSGNGNNGVVNGATLSTDRFGNTNSAYFFDGLNDEISANVNITQNITVSCWIKSQFTSNDFPTFFNFYSSTSNYPWVFYAQASYNTNIGSRYVTLNNSSSPIFSDNVSNVLSLNNWQFVTIVVDSNMNKHKLYLNGVLINENIFQGLHQFADKIMFGSQGQSAGQLTNFYGFLDDIGIWNRALTPSEITSLYNQNQCITNVTVTDTLIINVGQMSYSNPVAYANNITIYPNPASTQINISFNNITDLTGGTIKIINSLGQQVATTPITLTGTSTSMALSSWGGNGLYFVQIVNAQGQIVDIKKIILQ